MSILGLKIVYLAFFPQIFDDLCLSAIFGNFDAIYRMSHSSGQWSQITPKQPLESIFSYIIAIYSLFLEHTVDMYYQRFMYPC